MIIRHMSSGASWRRLAGMLMHTPFHAEGIVTNLFTDANGTQHINLHRIPDRSGLWRYLGITLLLLSMLGCMAYHGIQALRRYQRHRQRSGRDSEILRKLPEPGTAPRV